MHTNAYNCIAMWKLFKRICLNLAHDLLAHPAIGISGGAAWAYRFHDICSSGFDADAIQMTGPQADVRQLLQAFDESGFAAQYSVSTHQDGQRLAATIQRNQTIKDEGGGRSNG
jgi:hypothetical protein